MIIGYLGDGPWAHNVFDLLMEDETIEIAFVTVRYDYQDKWLINKAKENGVPIEISKNINSNEFISKVKEYGVELLVSMSFNQIFKSEIINIPKYKIINCHAGKLPFYRGRNILNWALINDEKEFGITVHYVDEGIDTGDIILQKTYEITDEDDYNTLLNRAYVGCADILYESIKLIQSGNAYRKPQYEIDKYGLYCGVRKPGDEIIEWKQTSRDLFNFIRALCDPGPQATTHYMGYEVKINKAKYIPDLRTYKGIPGQIIGKNDEGLIVKTLDTYIILEEYVCSEKIKIGERFQ